MCIGGDWGWVESNPRKAKCVFLSGWVGEPVVGLVPHDMGFGAHYLPIPVFPNEAIGGFPWTLLALTKFSAQQDQKMKKNVCSTCFTSKRSPLLNCDSAGIL
jgi:hypothetical protein